MTDMTELTKTSDTFSGHYEIQIILFLITIIVVTMHTTYIILELFWNQTLISSMSWPENQGILFFYISKTLEMIRISFMASLLNAVL